MTIDVCENPMSHGLVPDSFLDWLDKPSLIAYASGIAKEFLMFRSEARNKGMVSSQFEPFLAGYTFFSAVGVRSFLEMQQVVENDPALQKFHVLSSCSPAKLKKQLIGNLSSIQVCLAELYRQVWSINNHDKNFGMGLHWEGCESDVKDWVEADELPFQEMARKRLKLLYFDSCSGSLTKV